MNSFINIFIIKFKNMLKLQNILFIILIYIVFFMVYAIFYDKSYKEMNVGIIYYNGKKSNQIVEFLEKHSDANIIFYNNKNLLKNDVLTKKLNIGYIIKPSIESQKSADYNNSIVIYKKENRENYIINEIMKASIIKLVLDEIIFDTLNNKFQNNQNNNLDIYKILILTSLNTSLSNTQKNIYNINNYTYSNNKFLYYEKEIYKLLQLLIGVSSFIIISYIFSTLMSQEEISILKVLKLNVKSSYIYCMCNILYIFFLSIISLFISYILIIFFFTLDESFIIKIFILSIFYCFSISSLVQIIYLFSNNKFNFSIISSSIILLNIIISSIFINLDSPSKYNFIFQLFCPMSNCIFNSDNMIKNIIILILEIIIFLFIIKKRLLKINYFNFK